MSQGGSNVCKWNSNNKALLEEVTCLANKHDSQCAISMGKVMQDDQTYTQYAIGTPQGTGNSKVLGVG